MDAKRELSFDGFGINGPDQYRTRVATFASESASREYGRLFEAAPELLAACNDLQKLVARVLAYRDNPDDSARVLNGLDRVAKQAARAIAKAKGGAA